MVVIGHKVISDTTVICVVCCCGYDLTMASGFEKLLLRSTVSNWAGGLHGNIRHDKQSHLSHVSQTSA